jgi:hypothetical protein
MSFSSLSLLQEYLADQYEKSHYASANYLFLHKLSTATGKDPRKGGAKSLRIPVKRALPVSFRLVAKVLIFNTFCPGYPTWQD